MAVSYFSSCTSSHLCFSPQIYPRISTPPSHCRFPPFTSLQFLQHKHREKFKEERRRFLPMAATRDDEDPRIHAIASASRVVPNFPKPGRFSSSSGIYCYGSNGFVVGSQIAIFHVSIFFFFFGFMRMRSIWIVICFFFFSSFLW